jgi:urease accessory protein
MAATVEIANVHKAGGEATASPLARGSVRAALRLEFARNSTNGLTRLSESRQEAPLRVVRAFETSDGTALTHLHNVSGGLLGGDLLTLDVRAGACANVQLTTTGATRIYRSRCGAGTATQKNTITVGGDALLEYVPDATIPFAGARFAQRTEIRLEAGAGLFWWEILSPGREARDEVFKYESVDLKMDLLVVGKLVAAERLRLEPAKHGMSSTARMGAYSTWATFYICREGIDASLWAALETELRGLVCEIGDRKEVFWGVSTLPAHGVAVRCLARNGRVVLPGLHAIWSAAKKKLYGREAVPPRKVN